jgi:hypothetical protein
MKKWVDRAGIALGALTTKKYRYFSDNIDSPRVSEIMESLDMQLPEITGEGYYPFRINWKEKKLEGAFFVEQWLSDNHPVILYHHGAAEGSYDFSFKRILASRKKEIQGNLIAIQAPFNQSNKEFLASIGDLSNYTGMLAASVMIMDGLIEQLRKRGCPKILVTGLSLGGFVTNLHFAYRNTADEYRPIFAGGKMSDAFLYSAYSRITSPHAKDHPKALEEILDFEEEMARKDQHKLYPMLGEQDQIVRLEVQKNSYPLAEIRVVPYGHATGSLRFRMLREYILEGLEDMEVVR